ncbi:hypothetical protein ABDJ74_004922 [Salmonella enterica]
MEPSTKTIISFIAGVAVMILWNFGQDERRDRELRDIKDACSYVWEVSGKPTSLTISGYWKYEGWECVVFDNGAFRNMSDREQTAFEASLETTAGDF